MSDYNIRSDPKNPHLPRISTKQARKQNEKRQEKFYAWLGEMTKFYHGGVPGLKPGDIIEPGFERHPHDGCPICEAQQRGEDVQPDQVPDSVYFTSERIYAKFFADLYGRGWLYAVEPIGDWELSKTDHMQSMVVGHLKVLRVVEKAIKLTPNEIRQIRRSELRFRKEMAE